MSSDQNIYASAVFEEIKYEKKEDCKKRGTKPLIQILDEIS